MLCKRPASQLNQYSAIVSVCEAVAHSAQEHIGLLSQEESCKWALDKWDRITLLPQSSCNVQDWKCTAPALPWTHSWLSDTSRLVIFLRPKYRKTVSPCVTPLTWLLFWRCFTLHSIAIYTLHGSEALVTHSHLSAQTLQILGRSALGKAKAAAIRHDKD